MRRGENGSSISLGSEPTIKQLMRGYRVLHDSENPNYYQIVVSEEEMKSATGPGAVGDTPKERFRNMTGVLNLAPLSERTCVWWNVLDEQSYGEINLSGREQVVWAKKGLDDCGLEED